MNGTLEKIASPKQLKWLKSLLEERATTGWPTDWANAADNLRRCFEMCEGEGYDPEQLNVWMAATDRSQLTHNDFQRFLDKLRQSPYAAKSERAGEAVVGGTVVTEDGIYRLPNGDLFKVQYNRAKTNLYAKKIVVSDVEGEHWKCQVSFEYAPGAIKALRAEHRLSYEEAKLFGAMYGTCVACGRTLTDELSIALGIGPICGGRQFGGEFKAIVAATKAELKGLN